MSDASQCLEGSLDIDNEPHPLVAPRRERITHRHLLRRLEFSVDVRNLLLGVSDGLCQYVPFAGAALHLARVQLLGQDAERLPELVRCRLVKRGQGAAHGSSSRFRLLDLLLQLCHFAGIRLYGLAVPPFESLLPLGPHLRQLVIQLVQLAASLVRVDN